MTPTLLLSNRFTEDAQALWRAAIDLGWDVERLHGWRVPDHLRNLAEPVPYIEPLFAHTIADELGLVLPEPPADWLPRLPSEYRKRRVEMMPMEQARALTLPAFVKPPNDKEFPARVYACGSELPAWSNTVDVLVAEPVCWLCEFRCFVVDRRLLTFSVYLRDGLLQREQGFASTDAEDRELAEFVGSLLADPRVDLPDAVVLDVGVIADRGWAAVELNAAWGSGLYGCDPRQVLETVRRSVRRSPAILPNG